MLMPGRQLSSGYRFGFNGKEMDNEVKGNGNSLAFEARIYDPRIGRWASHDRIFKPWLSPYQFAKNNPANMIDPDGKDEYHFINNVHINSLNNQATSTYSCIVITKDGEDKFFNHVSLFMYNMETKIESQAEHITQFYPNNPDTRTGITSTSYGFGFLKKKDTDFVTLGKLALTSPEALTAVLGSGKYDKNVKSALENMSIEKIQEIEAKVLDLILLLDCFGLFSRVGVTTAVGTKLQSYTTEALTAAKSVHNGQKLYRIGTTGVSKVGTEAQFWSLENPLTNPEAYAQKYGVPLENIKNADFIEVANLKPGSNFITREAEAAPGLSNTGGGIEAVIERGGTTNNEIIKLK